MPDSLTSYSTNCETDRTVCNKPRMEKEIPSDAPPPYSDPRYPPTGGFPEGSAPYAGNVPPPGTYPPPAGHHPPPMASPGQPTNVQPVGHGQPPGHYPQPQGGYYPPPGAHPQPGPQPGPGPAGSPPQVVVVQQPAMVQTTVVRQNFGPNASSTICPYCQAQVVTRTSYSPGVLAWVMCFVLFCLFWPICWLPFVIDSCQDVTHSCPNCGKVISSSS